MLLSFIIVSVAQGMCTHICIDISLVCTCAVDAINTYSYACVWSVQSTFMYAVDLLVHMLYISVHICILLNVWHALSARMLPAQPQPC